MSWRMSPADLGPVALLGGEGHVDGVSDGEAGHGALRQRDDLLDGLHHALQAGVALQGELAAHLQTGRGRWFLWQRLRQPKPAVPDRTWLEYWTTPTLVAFSPMSSVLRMSIMNFLMVSNSCGRTLRELSMRKSRSTGPDGHFCSGPGGGARFELQPWSPRETSVSYCPPSGRGCGLQKPSLTALRCSFHIFTT